ncbi:MAG: polysaccharide biosynthesis/export family protein [Syntrophotaleaceae bacterium]
MRIFLGLILLAAVLTGVWMVPVPVGAWSLWNDPHDGNYAPVPDQGKSRKKEVQSVEERAAATKREALDAMRRLEKARRAAQQAEAERLALEQAGKEQDSPKLKEARQKSEAARQQTQEAVRRLEEARRAAMGAGAETAPSQPAPAVREEPTTYAAATVRNEAEAEQADLEKLRAMAAREQAEALKAKQEEAERAAHALEQQVRERQELERLRAAAARERAEALEAQKAEAERRAREQAAREQAELERLREMAARERAEAAAAKKAEADRMAGEAAAREQADLDRLRVQAAREREESLILERAGAERAALEQAIVKPAVLKETVFQPSAPSASEAFVPAPSPSAENAAPGDYLLGPGDVVDVSVWKDEALSRTVVISPDGMISLPLVGEVKAAGQRLHELKTDLESRLSPYVPDPVISLDVKQANSMQIYIIGKVNSPGRFLITSNINVLQALAMAGGLNPFADKDDIRIMRELGNGKTRTFDFDYKKVMRGDNLDQNIRLQRGDVIVVP